MGSRADDIRALLIRAKVPMIRQTFPVERWLMNTATKADRFYRINGRVVSRNVAAEAIRCGVAEFKKENDQ